MLQNHYKQLIQDVIKHEYIGPLDFIASQQNWVCYLGTTWPVIELKGLQNALQKKGIDTIVMLTFFNEQDLCITHLVATSYEELVDEYHDYGKHHIDYKCVILTTEHMDFLCYKDDENLLFSLCGEENLVKEAFQYITPSEMETAFLDDLSYEKDYSLKLLSSYNQFIPKS